MNYAAISTGPETHLDHLAPVCHLMGMPLIVTEEEQALLCAQFYPHIEVRHLSLATLTVDYLVAHFEAIFACGKFWALELKPLIELLHNKQLYFVHCPHGNSDKEASLQAEQQMGHDCALIYGDQMCHLIEGKCEKLIEMGNLRYAYYRQYKAHFDRLAQENVFTHLEATKQIILYAPTWDTAAGPSSFFAATEQLIAELAGAYNLLIKLHPLLEETHPGHYWHIRGKYEKHPNLYFLEHFPAIYPLLERSDFYIGDYSSIGYDFLLYDRPMFFLTTEKNCKGTFLHRCGKEVAAGHFLKTFLQDDQRELSHLRKTTYTYAFKEGLTPSEICIQIKKALSFFKDRA